MQRSLRAIEGWQLRAWGQRFLPACPWSSCPPRLLIGQDGDSWEQRALQWGRVLLSTGLF